MREIKFKVWDITFERMKLTGIGLNKGVLYGDDVVILQYTGLQDKNGKEIYEGDILQWQLPWQSKPTGSKEIVRWMESGAWWPCYGTNMVGATIIGNTYENPDLLKDSTPKVQEMRFADNPNKAMKELVQQIIEPTKE